MFHGTVRKLLALAAAAAALFIGLSAPARAQPAVAIDGDDIGGVVTGPSGPEAGVWVIAEIERLPNPLRADGRDRRARTLRRARPAEGRLRRLGARLWAGRIRRRSGRNPARSSTSRPCRRRTQPRPRSTIRRSTGIRCSRFPTKSQFGGKGRDSGRHHPAALAAGHEEQRLHRLSSARQLGDTHDSEIARRVRVVRRRLDTPREIGPGRRGHGQCAGRRSRRRAVQILRRLDRPHRQGRDSRIPSRSGRRASSATSSSPCGIGSTKSTTCTI